ncbi:MAG: heat-inducible transcription repressor HrcA [Clostridiaceae bacterium]|nr:heat-inducible transcription repressor HrcA [Clostridiaceae bacterium]
MIMDERKKRILQAIIDDYIDTAEPIGSRTIARKHELGLSSATIRNEMADLEEMGYLAQPHTSAGRVPSDKGYRLYVDKLMPAHDLKIEDIEKLRSEMEFRINELSQLLRQASAVLSRFTQYTSMAVSPQLRASTIKAIQVVPIETGKALVIVVNNADIVRNGLVKISEYIKPQALITISNILNNRLSGLALHQVNLHIIKELERETGVPGEILMPILDGAADCIEQIDNQELYVEGTSNILNYPEFKDVAKARELMSMIDEKSTICKALADNARKDGLTIKIGTENDLTWIKDCSLITVNYNIADKLSGTIGIIGPTRMEYPKVISSLRYISKIVSDEINRLTGQDPGTG